MHWGSFVARFGWNNRRRFLLRGMYRALTNLRAAGCVAAVIDGSFVTNKEEPGDYDLAFDPAGMNGSLVDPILRRHDDGRMAMKPAPPRGSSISTSSSATVPALPRASCFSM